MDITFFWLPYARTLKKYIPKIKLKLFKFYQNLPFQVTIAQEKYSPKIWLLPSTKSSDGTKFIPSSLIHFLKN